MTTTFQLNSSLQQFFLKQHTQRQATDRTNCCSFRGLSECTGGSAGGTGACKKCLVFIAYLNSECLWVQICVMKRLPSVGDPCDKLCARDYIHEECAGVGVVTLGTDEIELCVLGMRSNVVMVQRYPKEETNGTPLHPRSKQTVRSKEGRWCQRFEVHLKTIRRGAKSCLERSLR